MIFLIVAVPPVLSDTGLGNAGRVAFAILRWPILAAVMAVGIGFLYRFAVEGSRRGWLGFLTPGVAMAVWVIVSALFAVYTASYGKTYGALASIVVLLLLWLSSLAVLIGAEVDGTDTRPA